MTICKGSWFAQCVINSAGYCPFCRKFIDNPYKDEYQKCYDTFVDRLKKACDEENEPLFLTHDSHEIIGTIKEALRTA